MTIAELQSLRSLESRLDICRTTISSIIGIPSACLGHLVIVPQSLLDVDNVTIGDDLQCQSFLIVIVGVFWCFLILSDKLDEALCVATVNHRAD